MVKLGQTVRAARLGRGWSQAELAQRAGTSERTVARLESNGTGTISVLVALAEALGLEVLPDAPSAVRTRAPRLPSARSTSPRGEDRRAVELHRSVVKHLRVDAERVIGIGLKNIERLRRTVRGEAGQRLVNEWQHALLAGPQQIESLCLRDDVHGADLRQVGPFMGVLDETDRLAALNRAA